MKELSIEEKAKAYDRAIEIINDYYQKIKYSSLSSASTDREVLERAFPELSESEDERIRKEITELVMQPTWKTEKEFHRRKELCAWLEKQSEQKPTDEEIKTILQTEYEKGRADAIAEMQKPSWSEEDRTMAFTLMRDVDQMSYISKEGKNERIGWLNSLDEKFASTESAWSEEDERIKNNLVSFLLRISVNTHTDSTSPNYTFYKEIDWLKSLKERYTWKPSDEQMHYLYWIANIKLGDSVVEQEVSKHLNELYQDLKKLKEE